MAEDINTDCKINSDEVVEIDCTPPSEELLKSQNFIDYIKYYRILKRISKRELS